MKPKYIAVVAALAAIVVQSALAGSLPEIMTPGELRALRAGQIARAAAAQADVAKSATPTMYTGKISDADSGGYLFKYRNYDPEMNRWTTVDPSRFPDGANAYFYAPNCLSEIDTDGCAKMSALNGALNYLDGNGEEETEVFMDYYKDVNFTPTSFDGFLAAYNASDTGNIDLTLDYDFGFTSFAVGRVTFRLIGELGPGDSGQKHFSGAITLDDDFYDFDARPPGERTLPAEITTRVANWVLGDGLGGDPYNITFDGSKDVTYE